MRLKVGVDSRAKGGAHSRSSMSRLRGGGELFHGSGESGIKWAVLVKRVLVNAGVRVRRKDGSTEEIVSLFL